MPGRGEPFLDRTFEFLRGQSCVGCHYKFEQTVQACGSEGFQVFFKHGLERLCVFPLRMPGCQGMDAVKDKQSLEIEGLFRPECSVIVEHCDALISGHRPRTAFTSHLRNELPDGVLRPALVPRGQRVRRACTCRIFLPLPTFVFVCHKDSSSFMESGLYVSVFPSCLKSTANRSVHPLLQLQLSPLIACLFFYSDYRLLFTIHSFIYCRAMTERISASVSLISSPETSNVTS